MEVRSVQLNIPEIIVEYLFAKNENNREECSEIKSRFLRVYVKSSEVLKSGISKYICKLLNDKKLDHSKDLDNMFGEAVPTEK